MSSFIIIGLPASLTKNQLFDHPVQLKPVESHSIRKNLLGGRSDIDPYLVLVNGYSTDIVNEGERRHYCSHLFIEGIARILQHRHSVPVILRFFRGHIETEILPDCPKQEISFEEFSQLFPNILQNTRYVVVKGGE